MDCLLPKSTPGPAEPLHRSLYPVLLNKRCLLQKFKLLHFAHWHQVVAIT